ncbi:MAG TPA: CoA transferase [Candidatus Lustribacter sp.]
MLEGYRIVALATNIPVPVAAARLRALGASVVKVEPPRGDALAYAAPDWYARIVDGMQVVTMDLREPALRERLGALLADADLLLTAMRARTLATVGLDEATLRAVHPQLSHVALVGEAPPRDDRPGHDLTYQARAGTIGPPAMPRALVGDMAAAEQIVSASLGALLQRERSGATTFTHVSITDAVLAFAQPFVHGLTAPGGALGGGLPAYGIYPAADGWVAVAALEPHFAQRLREMLGISELDRASLQTALAARGAQAWEMLAQEHDVPLVAVR